MPEASQARADGAAPRLVVPERFVVDDRVRERLHRQLERAAPDVAGIVAPPGPLAPGESFRVHAQWCVLEPMSALTPAPGRVVGAALLRDSVDFAVQDDVIEVAGGLLLVDAGTHVHDRFATFDALTAASERGRAPFPCRPTVLFLAIDPAPELESWARRAVNRLVRREVEARLATPTGDPGQLHLTRPCAPSEESVLALDPDVIVALDGAALRAADQWSTSRSTVVIQYDPNATSAIELVPWTIRHASGRHASGRHASGRLRARIGPSVHATELDALVHRLAAGPQPVPPSDGSRASASSRLHAPVVRDTRSMTVVIGEEDPAAAVRIRSLVDQLIAVGVRVTVVSGEDDFAAASPASLVLIVAAGDSDAADNFIAERRAAGLRTVLDLGLRDLDTNTPDGTPMLTERAIARVHACGLVISAPGAVHRVVRTTGVRALAMPPVLTRARAAELWRARSVYEPGTTTIGWHLDSAPEPAFADAAGAALERVLRARPDVTLDVTGDPDALPAALRVHQRVTVSRLEPEPKTVAARTVHVWTPPLAGAHLLGDTRVVVEVSLAGVPVVTSATARAAVEGHVAPELVLADPPSADAWEDTLLRVLDDPDTRIRISREVARHARNVYSAVAFKVTANRFFGWASYSEESQ